MAATLVRLPTRQRPNLVLRDGVWIFRKRIKGKVYRKSTGCRDYKTAEKRAAQIETQILEHTFGWTQTVAPTVAEWIATYQAVKVPTLKSPGYFVRSLAAFAACPGMATKRIDALTRSDCDTFLNSLKARGWQANSIRTTHCVLASAWNYAIKGQGHTFPNPWSFPMRARVLRERVLTVEEQQAVWTELSPLDQRFLQVDLMAGLRHGEMSDLKTSDVDFTRQRLRVFGKGSKLRYLPMAPACAEVLRDQLAHRDTGTLEIRVSGPLRRIRARIAAGYVWPFAAQTVRKRLTAAATRAGVPHFTIHDLRRTFATRCAELGVPMKRLQGWLGHASIKTTAEHYVHLNAEDDLSAIEAVVRQAMKGTA